MVVLERERHVEFLAALERDSGSSSFEHYMLDHKKTSGVYWALSSLELLGELHRVPKKRILQYLGSCYHPDHPGFGGNQDQDPHLLYTLSAVQIYALYGELGMVQADKVAAAIAALQLKDGSFTGDQWGEVDTRFSYAAILALRVLGKLHLVDQDKAVEFILRCQNFDGGFGCIPGAESHAGQRVLALTDSLAKAQVENLGWWLCQRQLPCGGFNGRPDKVEDVCYSWWVLSSLSMLNKSHWIDGEKLSGFILDSQDCESGGIADRPGDIGDVFHTFFGLAGLSLLGQFDLTAIDPAFALPVRVAAAL